MGQYTGCNPDVVGSEKDKRIAELEAALRAVHPEHPQPELCSACKTLGRRSQ